MKKEDGIFHYELVMKSVGISWWKRILLMFCKPRYGCDWGKKHGVLITAKTLFGKTYIVDETIV